MLEDKSIFQNPLEKEASSGKSQDADEKTQDFRLKMVKESFIEWFSQTYMDKEGNLFDSKGNLLAKVKFELQKYPQV